MRLAPCIDRWRSESAHGFVLVRVYASFGKESYHTRGSED